MSETTCRTCRWRYGWRYFIRYGLICAWGTWRLKRRFDDWPGLWFWLDIQWQLAWEPADCDHTPTDPTPAEEGSDDPGS